MQPSLQGIANKAKRDKKHRFRDLYRMLNEEFLFGSWRYLNKRAAPGIDRITAAVYEENLQENILDLVERLKGKRYRAKLVRRAYIPKGKGQRPLGIPAIEDKLVQVAVARLLSAIFEPIFLPVSYGYRPHVGPLDAVRDVRESLFRGRYGYVVEADVRAFFDHIDHEWMIKMLEQRIDDKAFLGLIRKWLKAGVLDEDGHVLHPVSGTPQGGIVSPVLANVYLHYVLDLWFEKRVKRHCMGEAYLCRFADDFICAFRYLDDAHGVHDALHGRFEKFGLALAEEKTGVIRFSRYQVEKGESFDFLGFEFRWGLSRKGKPVIKIRTSRKRFRKSVQNFKEWCRGHRSLPMRPLFAQLNAKLRGYNNYYGIRGNSKSLSQFYWIIRRILYKWLNRRSQKRSFNFVTFTEITMRYGLLTPRITEKHCYQRSLSF